MAGFSVFFDGAYASLGHHPCRGQATFSVVGFVVSIPRGVKKHL